LLGDAELKPGDVIWLATGTVVFVAIATKTDWIQKAIGHLKGSGGYYYDPLVQEQYPSQILQHYAPHEPLTQETHPSVIHEQYQPHIQPVGHPNQHLCTGSCKKGTCDSQGFCIDSGCGSVIRGESHCEEKKTTKGKHKGHNQIHPTSSQDNLDYLNSQYPDYSQIGDNP
jgi:hypothetical protein